MCKLYYKTKPPKKGFCYNESFMTHEIKNHLQKKPSKEIEKQALELVGNTMYDLIKKLSDLGYDPTKAGFYIHYKG